MFVITCKHVYIIFICVFYFIYIYAYALLTVSIFTWGSALGDLWNVELVNKETNACVFYSIYVSGLYIICVNQKMICTI